MTQRVVIVDYGSGNLRSAAKSFERASRDQGAGAELLVSARAEEVAAADRIVLPGVGAFAACYRGLRELPGMIDALEEAVIKRGRPFMGICVGMQLMATSSEEQGSSPGLNWIGGKVVALDVGGCEEVGALPGCRRVPHMGWNDLELRRPAHPLLAGLEDHANVYFVHGYRFQPDDVDEILATTHYGEHITAVICRDNMAGTQFHPEKSQGVGLRMISNFLNWQP